MNESKPMKRDRDPTGHDDPTTARSESLLPAPTADAEDGNASFNVAEEVSFDQQSDRVRQIGNLPADGAKTPAGPAATAIAETLSREPGDSTEAGRAVPPPSKRGD